MLRLLFILGLCLVLAEARSRSRVHSHSHHRRNQHLDDDDQILYSVILFRHGDRAVNHPFKNTANDNNPVYYRGHGQLLPQGVRRHFKLGQYFADRYINEAKLLSATYTPSEIYARSVDMDRVLMSGLANLAGLYYPTTDYDKWNENIGWQPVPLHSTPQVNDEFLGPFYPCQRYDKKYAELMASDKLDKFKEDFEDLLEVANEYSGTQYDWSSFYSFADHVWTDAYWGLPQPDWIKPDYPERCMNVYLNQLYWWYEDPEMSKFRVGKLLNNLVLAFQAAAGVGKFPAGTGTKMTYYSGQAETVAPLLYCLGVFNNIVPGFTAAVMIELHKTGGSYNVQVYYKNDTRLEGEDVDAYFMDLPGCPYPCSLVDFIATIKKYTISDLPSACKVPDDVIKRESNLHQRHHKKN